MDPLEVTVEFDYLRSVLLKKLGLGEEYLQTAAQMENSVKDILQGKSSPALRWWLLRSITHETKSDSSD